jgi:hypothetical protein
VLVEVDVPDVVEEEGVAVLEGVEEEGIME